MSSYIIEGGKKLEGTVKISGSKKFIASNNSSNNTKCRKNNII